LQCVRKIFRFFTIEFLPIIVYFSNYYTFHLITCKLEVCGVWFFPLLLRSCVSKIDSWWYDSWLPKNYRLLLLFNSCHKSRKVQNDHTSTRNISKTLWLKITLAPTPNPVPIKNILSWSCSGSGWKALTPAEVDSCTPDPAHLWCKLVIALTTSSNRQRHTVTCVNIEALAKSSVTVGQI